MFTKDKKAKVEVPGSGRKNEKIPFLLKIGIRRN
jgi:hypothetical protein